MIEINLLPPQNILDQKEKEIRSSLIGLIVVLAITLLLGSGLVFVTNEVITNRLTTLEKEKTNLELTYASLIGTVTKLQTVKQKVSAISTVRSSQTDFSEIITAMIAILDKNYTIKSLEVTNANTVTMVVSAPNFDALKNIIQKLSDVKTPFKNVMMTGLRQSSEGSYDFTLSMIYRK